ncbi:hypothetical protein BV898_13212 [Hypsibius exemplaris]|uniref:Uncharacterized protein n=1 Tax=Hypsibius exemplaris TaxID=2072580 RepID=A0A1W0WBL3_HYPEX|nr:hypothetical protein BV898_13212 [Hypsibius exemplaris]
MCYVRHDGATIFVAGTSVVCAYLASFPAKPCTHISSSSSGIPPTKLSMPTPACLIIIITYRNVERKPINHRDDSH